MDRYQEMSDLRQNWTPPAELIGSGPRETRLSGAGIAISVLAGLLILGGAAAGIGLERVAKREMDEQALLREQGKQAEGSVTKLWRARDKENSPMVAYEFQAEGSVYGRSVEAPLAIWKRLAVGAPLEVRFLPADPARNHPRDWEESIMPIWVPFVLGGLLSAGGIVLAFVLRRDIGLLSEGRPAPAVVTRYSNAGHGQKNVHYEFPLLSGSVAKGKSGPTRTLPAIGTTLTVIYDSDNPRRNAAYPFQMVKLANVGRRVK
jgi:hypothetical protein